MNNLKTIKLWQTTNRPFGEKSRHGGASSVRRMTDVKTIVDRMRLAPFILCGLTALEFSLIVALPTVEAVEVAAQLICTSPALCLLIWWAGRPMHFCKWWTMEVFLPFLPAAEGILAHYNIGGTGLWLAAVALVLMGSIVNGVMIYSRKLKFSQ